MAARIILKQRGGTISKVSGDDYVDVTATGVVIPKALSNITTKARRHRKEDGFDEATFDDTLRPIVLKLKANTSGDISIVAVFDFSYLKRVGSWAERNELLPERVHCRFTRGLRFEYLFSKDERLVLPQLFFEIGAGKCDDCSVNTWGHAQPSVETDEWRDNQIDEWHDNRDNKSRQSDTFENFVKVGCDIRLLSANVVDHVSLKAKLQIWGWVPRVKRQVVLSHVVYFETEGQEDLSPTQLGLLKKWAETIKKDDLLYRILSLDKAVFDIKGHASKTDTEERNKALSSTRASNVKRRLKEAGLEGMKFVDKVEAAGERDSIQTDVPPKNRNKAYLKDRWASVSVVMQLDANLFVVTERVRSDLVDITNRAKTMAETGVK